MFHVCFLQWCSILRNSTVKKIFELIFFFCQYIRFTSCTEVSREWAIRFYRPQYIQSQSIASERMKFKDELWVISNQNLKMNEIIRKFHIMKFPSELTLSLFHRRCFRWRYGKLCVCTKQWFLGDSCKNEYK